MTNCSAYSEETAIRAQWRGRWSTLGLALLGCVCLCVASGCATGGNIYQAHEMPGSLIAPPQENTRILDLSTLSSGDASTNIIGPGDLLDVTIVGGLMQRDVTTTPIRVGDDGFAIVPAVGRVRLAGMELEAADVAIAEATVRNGIYRNPNVTVSFRRKRMNRILVLGAVKKPGTVMVPTSESDLLSVIVAAGALAEDAGSHVEIKNAFDLSDKSTPPIAGQGNGGGVTQTGYAGMTSGGKSFRIDLISAAKKGANSYYIADGGVVFVEKRDPQAVHVTGLVKKPNQYEYPTSEDLSMLGALALAGHTTTSVADKVFIIRRAPGANEPSVIQCSIARAKRDESHNVRLAPGDIVSVEHTPATIFMEVINIVKVGATASLNPLLF